MSRTRRCIIADGFPASERALASLDPQAARTVADFRRFLAHQSYEAEIFAARQRMLDDGAPALTPEQSLRLARASAPSLFPQAIPTGL